MYLGCFQDTQPYRVCLATDSGRFDRQQHCDVRPGMQREYRVCWARACVIGQRAWRPSIVATGSAARKAECRCMSDEHDAIGPGIICRGHPTGEFAGHHAARARCPAPRCVVAAEDTRLTRRLLSHYQIHTQMIALHEHNESTRRARGRGATGAGEAVAYVTDAGTPAISDPGALLVRRIREAGLAVVPVPGPSALTAACRPPASKPRSFVFYGFLPAKAGARQKARSPCRRRSSRIPPCSTRHRIGCRKRWPTWQRHSVAEREIVIARELTKMFESWHRCAARRCGWHGLQRIRTRNKGEFVLIVAGAEQPAAADDGRPSAAHARVAAARSCR